MKKEKWNIGENQDWSGFRHQVLQAVPLLDSSSQSNLASSISATILKALHDHIGLRSSGHIKKPKSLPPNIVNEFKLQRELEKTWKSLNSSCPSRNNDEVKRAEQLFLDQKNKTRDLLLLYRKSSRSKIIERCKEGTVKSRKSFWSYVSPSKKQSTDISAVINPSSGVLKCDHHEIKSPFVSFRRII